MKAKDIAIGTPICFNSNCIIRYGVVIANNLRSGDECLLIEEDNSYKIIAQNVNDIKEIK